jgi:hypothetical protein
MKSNIFCPISDKRINERVVRTNALLTVSILLVFGFTQNIYLITFLAIDFILRATPLANYSLIGVTSKNITRYLQTDTVLINAGPKIFAARIGLALASIAVVALLFSLNYVSLAIASILALFSFLEGAFGICVACRIYPYWFRLIYK